MGLGQFADLRGGGGLARKRGVVFLMGGGGVDTSMHTTRVIAPNANAGKM